MAVRTCPMENMVSNSFWQNKKVFLTGHTGFKGSWLAFWLAQLGAKVTGYALSPPSSPALFSIARIDQYVHSVIGDIRDQTLLSNVIVTAQPDVVFHLAA